MAEERIAKRIRQACQNCRRKKTRCPGEKPVCSFCARLRQKCCWDTVQHVDQTLVARVEILESKLGILDSSAEKPIQSQYCDADHAGSQNVSKANSGIEAAGERSEPITLPPLTVLRSIAKTYFRHCHNQPYCYFRENYFSQKLEDGAVPSYLLMAIMALSGRFSDDPFFQGRRHSIIEDLSRFAWVEIFKKSISEEAVLEIALIQAASMLAVVDFTNGRHNLAWMKIGLAVRFAQSLDLGNMPPKNLTSEQQDERVLTFWSVYLLDRLVSCGYNRPPTISDRDCFVQLPSEKLHLPPENPTSVAIPRTLSDDLDTSMVQELDYFAHTVLMASVLGRIERYSMQKSSSNPAFPPWHAQSDYTKIYSLLLSFETYSDAMLVPLPEGIDIWLTAAGNVDQQAAGRYIFPTILYHINQCLLHHPFLLKTQFEACKTRVPQTFLRDCIQRGREHAHLLTLALDSIRTRGLTMMSFYGYASTITGTIHSLFLHHEDPRISGEARHGLECSISFLQHGQTIWSHYARMASALGNFNPDLSLVKWLLPSTPITGSQQESPKDQELGEMWNFLDYGWLSDSARAVAPGSFADWTSPSETGDNHLPWSRMTSALACDAPFCESDVVLNTNSEIEASIAWSGIIDTADTSRPLDLDSESFWARVLS